jgi:hypothetical protein
VEKCGRVREVTDDNILWRMRITCYINKTKDTLRIYNTYYFPTATIVMGIRLNIKQAYKARLVCYEISPLGSRSTWTTGYKSLFYTVADNRSRNYRYTVTVNGRHSCLVLGRLYATQIT